MLSESIKNFTAKEAKERADNNKDAKERADDKNKQYIEKEVNKRYEQVIKKIMKESDRGLYYTIVFFDFCYLYSTQINDCLIKLLKQKDFNVDSYNCADGNTYVTINWK